MKIEIKGLKNYDKNFVEEVTSGVRLTDDWTLTIEFEENKSISIELECEDVKKYVDWWDNKVISIKSDWKDAYNNLIFARKANDQILAKIKILIEIFVKKY